MSTCRVFSCVVGRGCFLWPVHSLGKTLLAFALLHSIFQGQICLLFQVFLEKAMAPHSSTLAWKIPWTRGLVGYSPGGCKESDTTEWLPLPFGNNEFMIWAIVSSWSCFCWLYRASPSLAAKNIINLISVLPIWWCPHVESSLVLLEKGICYAQCVFLAKFY